MAEKSHQPTKTASNLPSTPLFSYKCQRAPTQPHPCHRPERPFLPSHPPLSSHLPRLAMAAAITENELEVAAILQSFPDFFHGTEPPLPCSSLNSIRWGAKKRRSAGTAEDARCKAHRGIGSPPPPPHFRSSPSPQPPPQLPTFELPPAPAQIDVGENKTAELDEAAAGTGSPVSPLYFDQLRECADHRRKAPSPPAARPVKKSRVQHKDWVRAQTNEISRLREEKRVLTQKADAARIHHDALLAENSRLKELKSRISNHQRSHQPPPPQQPRRIETISFPIERKPFPSPSPTPTPEPEARTELSISTALFANYPRQRVEIPDLNCYEEVAPPPQLPRGQKPLWVAPPLERHLYRFEGATPEEKRAATAAARRRRVEIKRRKAAAAAAGSVTAVPAAV